jgi:hypothetical protein
MPTYTFYASMVKIEITNLDQAPEDLVQFVNHLREGFEEIDKKYEVEISVTNENYETLPGSQIPTSTGEPPNIKEKGVEVSINFKEDKPENPTRNLAETFYGKENFVLLRSYRGSEGREDIYIFELN